MLKNRFSPKTTQPTIIEGESLTQQHMAAETDINNMINRYRKGGTINLNSKPATWGVAQSEDFQTMQNMVTDMHTKFNNLPARLRSKFQNSPYQFLRWLENPENAEKAIQLGLVERPSAPYDPDQILDQAQKASQEALEALKADPEAQPGFKKPAPQGDAKAA